MRGRDRDLAERLKAGLLHFDVEKQPLYGIHDPANMEVFIEQLLDSIHRVSYVSVIRTRKLSKCNADPNEVMFDPIKAAILHHRKGNIDEAFWLVFLFAHFGKHARAGWHYARAIYGRLGEGIRWDWANTSVDTFGFREWLHRHQDELKREDVPHGFGNHRKFESLNAYSPNGTGTVVESYVRWVGPPNNHQDMINQAYREIGDDPREMFDYLYQSMQAVTRFGRTARFDYLTMIGNIGLAAIEPGSAYLQNSTGPIKGAHLLFGEASTATIKVTDLDKWLIELDTDLKVGMQVLEDALCNWQKSPSRYKKYRG